MDIDCLELTIRSNNSLRKHGIDTVEKLVELTWDDLQSIKGLGDKSISEIAWQCIQLLNGRLYEQAKKWNEQFGHPMAAVAKASDETKRQAMLFMKIKEIVESSGK